VVSDPRAEADGMTIDRADAITSVPRTFVVPLDGSDFAARAIPIAAELAARFDAGLVLATVPTTTDAEARAVPPRWLDDAASAVRTARVEVAVVDTDHPAAGVVGLLRDRGDAGLVMATHGRGFLGTAALGGVAQEIVRVAGVPVLLVGRACDDHPGWRGPVLVCHDGSAAAGAALAPAQVWAAALRVPIEVVHVFHPLDVSIPETSAAAIDATRAVLGPDARSHIRRSYRPADAIHDLAEEVGASLVVMSTHGRTGLALVALGSVTMDVVRMSLCPVLVTRPLVLAGQGPSAPLTRNHGAGAPVPGTRPTSTG
jgi:nucleotide-binding universal stress UspA family protein